MAVRQRQDRCLYLRLAGKTWPAIGAETGLTETGAYRAAMVSLRRQPATNVREGIETETARLEMVIGEAVQILRRRHYVVEGKDAVVVRDPETDEPLDDDGPKLQALALIVRTSESIRKLRGYDAPTRKIVEVVTDEQIASMIAELEAGDGDDSGVIDVEEVEE